ncbi:MGDG synthase family glycosyltransferase [Gloeothece verrucosa]|uniref:Monogalactosyldiacylglycerol synthase n=1 Tax=Gloeothece verrucosa (strain PCC 7822) TaxID=497965 RepID=E0UB96_GLOV7|nr:glycosyltransferase [Gloeothece verrucosa]ADN17452.1 Monogalactosyldiacylglycerol synthase [Gloeothece verrucosa PCC 7822]
MTKILILYSSLGDGHLNAAKALYEAFSQNPEVEVRIEDALDYASALYRNTIIQLYKQLSEKVPLLYRAYYEGTDTTDLETSLDDNLSVAKLERLFFNKLEQLVIEFAPDAIVSVQQIPGRLIQLVEEKNQLAIPHYVVITDVIAHSSWLNYGINAYFIPSQLTANVLIQRGADPSLFQVTGIPVKLEIIKPKTQAEVRLKHNLPLNTPVVTVFGGGLNSKRVRTMVSELLSLLSEAMIIVAAGRNETLLEVLEDLEETEQVQLRKLGLIDYVDDLIVASDLIITKAGGLITSEILARNTPMIIVDPIPGQEEQNADVITIAGAGIQLRLIEMVGPAVEYLLKDRERLAQMRQVAEKVGQPRAALNIAEYILNNIVSQTVSEVSLINVETVQNSELSIQT